jgi:hypothetical protein
MGLLVFASYVAVNAIFALAAMAMGAPAPSPCAADRADPKPPPTADTSYIIPIVARMIYRNHPEVMFKPGASR